MKKILSLFISLVLWLGISGFGVAYGATASVKSYSPTNGKKSTDPIDHVGITFNTFSSSVVPSYNGGTATWVGPDGNVIREYKGVENISISGSYIQFNFPQTDKPGTYTLTVPANYFKATKKIIATKTYYSAAISYTYTLEATPAVLELSSVTPATYFNESMQQMSLTFAQSITIADASKITVTAGGKACAGKVSVEGNTLNFACDAAQTSGLVTLSIAKGALSVNGTDENVEFSKSWYMGERVTNVIGHITEYYGSTSTEGEQGMNKKEVVYYSYQNKSLGRCTYAKTVGLDEWKAADFHRYEYDANGHIVADNGYKWGVLEDGSEGFTYTGTSQSVYDANGLRTQSIGAQGAVVNYEYDVERRLVKETHIDANGATTQTITYSDFDDHGTAKTVASDGTLYSARYVLERTTDANGKIIKERKWNAAKTSVTYETRRLYDATGFLEQEAVFDVAKNDATSQYDVLTYRTISINEPVEGNAYRIKSWSKSYSSIVDSWSTSQTYTITESMAPEGEKYHATLTLAEAAGVNCVDLKVTLPEAIANASYGLNIYRKGVLIAGPVAYTAGFTYTDKNVANGDYDYFVEIASLDANGKQVSTYNVSDFVTYTFNADLPVPGNPYCIAYTEEVNEYTESVDSEDEDGNEVTTDVTTTQLDQTVLLQWEVPADAELFGFQGYNLYKVSGSGHLSKQNEELMVKDTCTFACADEESFTLQLEAVYQYGNVKSDAVTFKRMAPPTKAAYEGMATFYNEEYAYQLPEGMNAYWASIEEDGDGQCVLLSAMDDGIIPAATACIISGTEGKPFLMTQTETENCYDDNILSGSSEEMEASDLDWGYVYVLSVGSTGVGFYRYKGTVAANKAYIDPSQWDGFEEFTEENAAPALRIAWDLNPGIDTNMGNTTAIESVEVNRQCRPEVYDMLGRKVAVGGRGLYIVDGKKTWLK